MGITQKRQEFPRKQGFSSISFRAFMVYLTCTPRRYDRKNRWIGKGLKQKMAEYRDNRIDRRKSEEKKQQGNKWDDVIIGRNAVTEALRVGRSIDSILMARGNRTGSLQVIAAKAREKGIPVKETDVRKLDHMCGGENHQGVAALAAVKEYAQLDDLFRAAEEKGEAPFFILCDELEDPHNLGAILRTAECAGAHGVIVPERRSVGLSYAVGKASAGAVEYVPVCRVPNMAACIEELKKRGVWIYAADMDGEPWCQVDYTGAVGLVIGSEGFGVSRLVKEKSDFIISLPMRGKINSLNASVACGVVCYEVARQRAGLGRR